MIFPQLPHSSSTEEIHASFSSAGSPTSSARAWLTGSSSQKTHLRHLGGKSSRLSSVMLASRRDTRLPLQSDNYDQLAADVWSPRRPRTVIVLSLLLVGPALIVPTCLDARPCSSPRRTSPAHRAIGNVSRETSALLNRGCEGVDLLGGGVISGHPSNDATTRTCLCPDMEVPVALQQRCLALANLGEDAVGLNRVGQLDAIYSDHLGGQALRHRVRMPGISQPEVLVKQRRYLGGKEPHL